MKKIYIFIAVLILSALLTVFSACQSIEMPSDSNENGNQAVSEVSEEENTLLPEISEVPYVDDKIVSKYDTDLNPSWIDMAFMTSVNDTELLLERGTEKNSAACIAVVRLIDISLFSISDRPDYVEYKVQIVKVLDKNELWTADSGDIVNAYNGSCWILQEDGTYEVRVYGYFISMAEPGSYHIVALYESQQEEGLAYVLPYTLPLDKDLQYTDFPVGIMEDWETSWHRYQTDRALIKYGFLTPEELPYNFETGEWYDTSEEK